MYDTIKKEQEVLRALNCELNNLKIFMLGNTAKNEEKDEIPSECLKDDMTKNIIALDYALQQVNIISKAIKGGCDNVTTSE